MQKGFNNPIVLAKKLTPKPIKAGIKNFLRNIKHQIVPYFTNSEGDRFNLVKENKENFIEYNITDTNPKDLKPGLSAMIRAKNEESLIGQSINSIIDTFDEITFIDNNSNDRTLQIVEDLKRSHHLGYKINIFTYPFDVSPCGKAHNQTDENSINSLAYFYNWCKSKCQCEFIMKWDADMLLGDDALTLESMAAAVDSLKSNKDNLVIKTPVQSIYKGKKKSWLSVDEIYKEPRIFRNISSNYFKKDVNFESLIVRRGSKTSELKDVKIYEIKELAKSEFDHWSSLTFVTPRKVNEYRNFRRLNLGFESDKLQLRNKF